MLEAAGLTAIEETVYRFLVTATTGTAHNIAEQTRLPPATIRSVLAALCKKGLVTLTDGDPRHFAAIPPDKALLPRLQRHADALDQARTAITDLLDSYRNTRRRQDPGQLIELITGASALRQHLRHMQHNARHEMLWFCKTQYVAMPSATNRAEYDALARGVRYRVLYEQAFLNHEGAIAKVIEGVRTGEIARSVLHLPLCLAVADQAIAICSLAPGGPQGSPGEPTAVLVRGSILLEALSSLFERYWEPAVPLDVNAWSDVEGSHGVVDAGPLSETDRQLLSLLVAGVADSAIASHMGLSRRTVQRHIHYMMTLTGATTRMQLAWQAARQSWITEPRLTAQADH
ncbi:helix-turn-helix domain-containing protein [Streptomyces sp. NPDC055722]